MSALMLDLDLLRSFVSVVDTGGFTRAGERVHRTQSTVSQQIRRLEDSLGYPLLHRNGKQATPTEQGRAARVLRAADSRAGAGGARCRRATGRRRRRAARHAGGFCRLSADRAVVGFRPLTPGSAPRRALRAERASAPRDRARRARPCAVQARRRRRRRDCGLARASALGHQPQASRSISAAIRCRS